MSASNAAPIAGITHPLKFTVQHLQRILYIVIFAYIGLLFVSGLYYAVLETHWHLWFMARDITGEWHNLVPEGSLRHDIRDVGEGLFGGLLAVLVAFNYYKKSYHKKANALDKAEFALRIPNVKDTRPPSGFRLAATIPLVLVYALPGFFLTYWIITHFGLEESVAQNISHTGGGNFLTNVKSAFIEDWPKKVMGYGAAFFLGRRPAKAVFADVQLWFAERRVVQHKKLWRFWETAPFKARVKQVFDRHELPAKSTRAKTALIYGFSIVVLVGAVYGYYVLNYIAHHTDPLGIG